MGKVSQAWKNKSKLHVLELQFSFICLFVYLSIYLFIPFYIFFVNTIDILTFMALPIQCFVIAGWLTGGASGL